MPTADAAPARPRLPAELLRSIFIHAARDVKPKTKYAFPNAFTQHSPATAEPDSAAPAHKRRRRSSSVAAQSSLTSLLLVSKAVSAWVLAELLHTVALTSPSSIIHFGTLLKSRPELGIHVRRLWVDSVIISAHIMPCDEHEALQRILALETYILPNLPRLHDLALGNLSAHELRAHAYPLWPLCRARSKADWSTLRTLTVANMRALSDFLCLPGPPADKPRFDSVTALRIALPEEISAHRMSTLQACPNLRTLELVEPGLETQAAFDMITYGIAPAGIALQTFGCIRGAHPDRQAAEALFDALTRRPDDVNRKKDRRLVECASVRLRVYTQSPASYVAFQALWAEFTELAASCAPGQSNFNASAHQPHAISRSLQGRPADAPRWEAPALPSLEVLELTPGTLHGAEKNGTGAPSVTACASAPVAPSRALIPVNGGSEGPDFVPPAKAFAWKRALNDTLIRQWMDD